MKSRNHNKEGYSFFFDKAFVADKGRNEFPSHVEPMSKIIPYLNSLYQE